MISYISGLMSTQEDRALLESNFRQMDVNQDGKLDLEELKKGYRSVFGE